jgi:hypothetical protein
MAEAMYRRKDGRRENADADDERGVSTPCCIHDEHGNSDERCDER